MTNVKTANAPDHSMLAEHARGDSLRTIGKRHGVSHETARKIVLQTGSALIRDLERDLTLAELQRDGGVESVWPTILIPPQIQSDRMDALTMFFWARDRLIARGWAIEVTTRHVPGGGTVFQLATTNLGEKQ